jgi:hypothetical protein
VIGIGKYTARAIGGNIGKSAQKGTKFARVAFAIKSGEHEGDSVEWTGYFSGAATERTLASLRYCGCTFPGDDITNLEGIDTNDVEVVVEHEPYTYPDDHATKAGETITRVKVAWVNSPTGGMREEEQMDDRDLASFASSMKGALIQAKKRTGASSSPNAGRPAPARRAPTPPQDDFGGGGGYGGGEQDDIPF